ncbi:MAG: TRAP transporter substrate-binding protein DctP [Dehalococcoidales bacterium]
MGYRYAERFADQVTAASGGRLVLKCNTAGAIVPAAKEFDGFSSGVLDWGVTATGYVADKFPQATLFSSQIGGLSPQEYSAWYLVGNGMELAAKMLDGYNVKVLDGIPLPPETFLWTNKDLKTPDDLKGLKYRSGGGDEPIIFGEYLGTAGVFMPGGEIYESMQRGVIDGFQYSSPAVDYTAAFYEVAEYAWLSPIRQPSEYHWYWFNADSWESLPDDLKVLVEELALSVGLENYYYTCAQDIIAIEKIKEYGVTKVLPVPKSIEDAVTAAADDYFTKKRDEGPFWAEVLDSIDAFQNTYREAFQRF